MLNAGLVVHETRKIPNKLGESKGMFDSFFERDSCSWTLWGKTVSPFDIPHESPYSEMIVPTTDSIRIKGIFNRLLKNGSHVLIVGPTGTGKSVMIGQELRSQYNNEEYTHIQMAFSAQTTANQTQTIIDGKTFKLRKLNYCP